MAQSPRIAVPPASHVQLFFYVSKENEFFAQKSTFIALQKNGDQGLQVDLPCDAAFHYIVNRQRLVGVMGGHGG